MLSYPRPPITESVAQINYGATWDRKTIERIANALGADYQRLDELNFQFSITKGNVSTKVAPAGIRLTNSAIQQTVVIQSGVVMVARLAPYPGWDTFFGQAWDVFQRVRQKIGYQRVVRIGTRYVNRIDIPNGPDNTTFDLGDYLKFAYAGPSILGLAAPTAYLFQADFIPKGGWAKVVIRTGTTEPALIRHSSIMLDLDVFCDSEVPQSEADLKKTFEEIRELKNAVFKDCLTAKAEALFGASL